MPIEHTTDAGPAATAPTKLSARAFRPIALIVGLSLVLTLAYSFFHRIDPVVDARAYDKIAQNILQGDGFRERLDVPIAHDPVIVRAGPLYEYFLAGVYGLFGHTLAAVWIIQALLHVLTAYLLYAILRKLLGGEKGKVAGAWAAGIFAFHPDLIEISAMLMTETLYLFLVVLAIYFFVLAWNSPARYAYAMALGLSVGFAIESRPPVLLFIPVIMLWYLWGRRFRACALFLLMVIAVMTPWVVRNYAVYDQFIPTTLIGEYNFWVGNTLRSTGGQIADDPNPALAYAADHGYLGFKDKANKEFVSFIVEHPLVFAELTMVRAVRYFSLIRPMGFWFYQSGTPQLLFVVASLASIAALFIVGFSGLYLVLRDRSPIFYYLCAFAVLAPLPLLAATVESRYRFQIYPFLALFAGYFLADFWVTKSARLRILFTVAGILGLVSLVDLYSFWPTVLARLDVLF